MAWLAEMRLAASRWVDRGVDLLYPPQCAFCRTEEPNADGSTIIVCAACRRALTSGEVRCCRCADPLVVADAESPLVCRRCRIRPRLDGIVVLAGYDDDIRSAVLAAKRPGGEFKAAGLAALLLERHGGVMAAWQIDVIVPVPMHWLRRLSRGTSSADLLARHLAGGLGLPARGLLWRTRATPMQNELPPESRAANVRGAFHATPAASGKRVLLVDDVMTTGSTLDACRQSLEAAGAARVHAAVITRADGSGAPRERGAPA